jgi:oligopeptide transport system substrate-binding protein
MCPYSELADYKYEDLLIDDIVKTQEGFFLLANKNLSFIKQRKKIYLKKIIQTHINFRKKLLYPNNPFKRPFLQRFYKVQLEDNSPCKTLGICFAFCFFNDNEKFDFKHLSGIIKRNLSGIRIEEDHTYFCQFPQEKVLFCYTEIEKIRGKHLSLQETLKLKKVFLNEIGDTIETIYSDLFMPANEEEIYKHIATLSNDLSSLSSIPHVMISFVKQTHDVLYFNVVLVRIIQLGDKVFENIATSIPLKLRIYINKTSLLKASFIKEICVFAVEIPNSYFLRKNYSVDYLQARRYLSLILEEHIGEFRDYNGGLLIKQYEQLEQIMKDLSDQIKDFSLIEELFFSFVPSNTQTLISSDVALAIHQLFYKIKSLSYHALYKMEYIESKAALIIFIKTDQEKIESLLYSIVLDEAFLAAYTKKVVDNQTYFCFLEINPSDLSFLLRLKKALNAFEKTHKKIKKNTLCIPLQESLPPTLHPHLLTDTNSLTICKALYECITRINLDGIPEFAAASDIKISSCKKRYLITLRPTRWSNGENVTADHFIRAWKKAILPDSKFLRPHLFYIVKNAEKISKSLLSIDSIGLKKQGNLEILIELEHPATYFLQLLANPIYSPLYDCNDENPQIFNGPFRLISSHKNHEVKLIKNNFYWDIENLKLNAISFVLIKDSSKILEMFHKEELDWIGSPFSNLLQDQQHRISFQVKEVPVPFWLHCNTKNPKLSSVKIRKALSLAIDRDKVCSEILPGQTPSWNLIPESLSLIEPFNEKKNLNKAKDLFEKGLREINYKAHHFSLTLSYSKFTNFQEDLSYFLKESWEDAFGIKVILKEMEWDIYWNNVFNGEYEIGGACRFPIYLDRFCFLDSLLSVSTNYTKWRNNDFRKLIQLSKKTLNKILKNKYLKEAETILQNNLPAIPIFNRSHQYLCKTNLKNLIPPTLSYMDFKWAYFQ